MDDFPPFPDPQPADEDIAIDQILPFPKFQSGVPTYES